MGLTCITYILQLINLGLLFRLIFSYDFREKRGAIGLGIMLILISLCVRLGFLSMASDGLQLIAIKGTFILLPMIVFKGNRLRLFLLGVIYSQLVKLVFSSMSYVLIIFDLHNFNIGIATLILFFVVFVGTGVCLKNKRVNINKYMEGINLVLLMAALFGIMLMNWNGGVVYAASEESINLLIGGTHVLSLLIALLLLSTMILAQILLLRRKQLAELNQHNQKCIAEQTLQYHRLEEKDAALRSFKHDYKAHFAMIQSYLECEDVEHAKQYIREIGTVENTFYIHRTGNFIFDAILNQYAEMGRKAGNTLHVLGKMPKDVNISETDFCALLSNGMENAFEAVSLCDEKGTIQVEITNNEGYLFIAIENPTIHEIKYAEKGLFSSKKEAYHGIGTQNMISVAEKYHGNVKWVYEYGRVITKIKLKYK